MPEEKMKSKILGIIAAVSVLIATGTTGGIMYRNARIEEMRIAGVEALKSSVVLEEYREEQQAEIEKILDNGERRIMEADEQDAVDKINSKAFAKIAEIKTDAELDIEDGIETLRSSVSLKDYREEQREEVQKIMDDTEKSIRDASGEKEIKKLNKNASAKIAEIKTDAQLTAEEQAAWAAAQSRSNRRSSGRSSRRRSSSRNSNGCVSDDASNFY